MKPANKRLDLTGQRYGMLTVLEPAENIGKHTAWRCRCDCGRETVVPTHRSHHEERGVHWRSGQRGAGHG